MDDCPEIELHHTASTKHYFYEVFLFIQRGKERHSDISEYATVSRSTLMAENLASVPAFCPNHSSGGKNSSHHATAAHSADLRPLQTGGDEDKRFPQTELANEKPGDTLALGKKRINYLFINIIMVLRRMS